jgi:hypothetical protein
MSLGEMVNEAINAKREADTQAFADAVVPVCALTVLRDPSHEMDAIHLALLVETDRQEELGQKIEEFSRQWAGRIDLRLLGPMAPYDFVATQKPGG